MKNLIIGILCSSLFTISFSQTYTERIYFGTGEYHPGNDWHSIIQLERADTMNSIPSGTQYAPVSTIPLKQSFDGPTFLNFGHGFYLDEPNDELYLATIFTNQDNHITVSLDTAKGSIAIFDNISSRDGPQSSFRHIFGDSTELVQPHACWLDESRDMLYVSNTMAENILVFHNASTVDGNIAPDRVINSTQLGRPVYIFLDEVIDRMFVACMPGTGPGIFPQVVVYNNASTLNGTFDPDIRIFGDSTRLDIGNPTVHNLWFEPNNELLAVGHHTNELLMFDLSGVPLSPPTPTVHNILPRVIRVDDPTEGHDSTDVNLYGFFWDTQRDLMFCSVGIDIPGNGPWPGSPPEALKIFSNVSDTAVNGLTTPDRIIYYDNGGTYFPPQPIWVVKTLTINRQQDREGLSLKLFPNPFQSDFYLEYLAQEAEEVSLEILNAAGVMVYKQQLNLSQGKNKSLISPGKMPSGWYTIRLQTANGVLSEKLIIEK